MEIVKCKCGRASISYQVIGEDMWGYDAINTSVVKACGIKHCICMLCGQKYDEFDPFMVKRLSDINLGMKKVKVGNKIGATTSIIPHRNGLYPVWFSGSVQPEFIELLRVKFI